MDTPNFILREWTLDDAPSLARNANNIKIWNNHRDYFPHPYTQRAALEFIKSALTEPGPVKEFAIEINGEAVGSLSLMPRPDVTRVVMELGYWLGEAYWGEGVMTAAVKEVVAYAFRHFQIEKVWAPVFAYNEGSQKVLLKAGFELEAVMKRGAIKNGEITDVHYYSLFR